jgi:hypothetical protein
MRSNFQSRKPRSIPVGPLILILIGIFFLLDNLGIGPGGSLVSLVRYWPVLVIIWGINSILRKEVFGSIVLLGFGGTFLLSNLNLLTGSPWISLVRLWPLLIVAAGLEVIFARKNIWYTLAGVVIGMLLLSAGLWFSEARMGSQLAGDQAFSQPLGDFDQAKIILQPPVANLSLDALNDSGNLIEGTYTAIMNVPISQDLEMDRDVAIFSLGSRSRDVNIGFWEGTNLDWTVGLNTAVTYDLDIQLGVGETYLDLSDLKLSAVAMSSGVGLTTILLAEGDYSVKVETGVGQTIIELPPTGSLRLDVELGVGEVIIRVPDGMKVRVQADRGLTAFQTPAGFIREGSQYVSPGYSSSDNQAEISVSVGVGSIVIR